MKKIVRFLLLSFIFIGLLSCSKSNKINSTKTVLLSTSNIYPGISKPADDWQFSWKEENSKSLGMACTPKVDSDGNIYFIGNNFILYSVSKDGNIRWKQPDVFGNWIETTKDGIMFYGPQGFVCLYFDGAEKWISKELNGSKCIPLLGPDGNIYASIYRKSNNTISSITQEIVSIDSSGKSRWSYLIPTIENQENYFVNGFFDQQSNFYCLFIEHDLSWTDINYVIFSLTSSGSLRWKKYFMHGKLIPNFLPEGLFINQTFLLAFSKDDSLSSLKEICAYDTNGTILWTYYESRIGTYQSSYALNGESTFYVPFSSDKIYLQAINIDGLLQWERFMVGTKSTQPIIDNESHIYIGVNSSERSIYAFYADGVTIWSKKEPNEFEFYDHSLILGPNQKLYYGTKFQNQLYCVKDNWK